jgi:glycosyltransferase involved in cell wall biosynthesis
MGIDFLIFKNEVVGGENILKLFSKYSILKKNIYEYSNTKELLTSCLTKKKNNTFVFTTLQKNNILNMFFSIFKRYNPMIRETFLYEYRKDSFINRILNYIYKLLIKITKPLVIVQSYNMERDFKNRFNYNNLMVINNPIDPNVLKYSSSHSQVMEKYIIYVGRLVYDKGVQDLIEVYLKSKLPKNGVKLLIAGDGNYKDALTKLAINSEYADKINFLGNVSNPLPLIKDSKFLVLPSYHEGFPNVILESIGLEKIFLSNNIPSVKEMCLEDTTFLYNDKDELLLKMNSFLKLEDSKEKEYVKYIKFLKEKYLLENIIKEFDKKIGEYIEKY